MKSKHLNIPKGWRRIRVGEKIGPKWKFYRSLSKHFSMEQNNYENDRILPEWNNSIYIKPK